MLDVIDDGADVRTWINLGHVAMIEVPQDEYHRLMSPEAEDPSDIAANDG